MRRVRARIVCARGHATRGGATRGRARAGAPATRHGQTGPRSCCGRGVAGDGAPRRRRRAPEAARCVPAVLPARLRPLPRDRRAACSALRAQRGGRFKRAKRVGNRAACGSAHGAGPGVDAPLHLCASPCARLGARGRGRLARAGGARRENFKSLRVKQLQAAVMGAPPAVVRAGRRAG